MHSFAAGTHVAVDGDEQVPIEDLRVGDRVDAWNEATGTVESHVVTAVHLNADPVTGTVVIDDEPIETTPHHHDPWGLGGPLGTLRDADRSWQAFKSAAMRLSKL